MMADQNIRILTKYADVRVHLDEVIASADTNKKPLGFFPKSFFEDQAALGRLWIAVCNNSGEFFGYLLYGCKYPKLSIIQLYVQKKHRHKGIGKALLNCLEAWVEKSNYLIITARVAADLSANKFWECAGFPISRQLSGGKTLDRMINVRVKELKTPSLLDMIPCEALGSKAGIHNIQFRSRPIIGIQTYVIDLNIFFDVVKNRIHRSDAAKWLGAGLRQEVRVFVTPEFVNELRRTSTQYSNDPVLELAKELPVLPQIPQHDLDNLIPELAALVFPDGGSFAHQRSQSRSDLLHLAYCIHHRATGFVTRERAILSTSQQLQETYSLEILSPVDFAPSADQHDGEFGPLRAHFGKDSVSVASATEHDREEVERFLMSRGVAEKDLAAIWHPGASTFPRRRITAHVGADLIAAASWDGSGSLSQPTVLHLYVDESAHCAENVIDHVLEVSLRDAQLFTTRLVVLYTGIEQSKTRATAEKRGFIKNFHSSYHSTEGHLSKLAYNGLISSNNWNKFSSDVVKLTGLKLPRRIPTIDEFHNTGIVIRREAGTISYNLNLFDFETMVSPGVVLCPGRTATIIPIQLKFAKGLFAYIEAQSELFPGPEALLHVEKAYFKSARKTNQFYSGELIFFYLSGSGGGSKEVIGCARITYSDILSINEVELNLTRQGVLLRRELEAIANNEDKLQVFTFDNFNLFPYRVPFNVIKSKGIVSGANLVTAEHITPKHCAKLCEFGFQLGVGNNG